MCKIDVITTTPRSNRAGEKLFLSDLVLSYVIIMKNKNERTKIVIESHCEKEAQNFEKRTKKCFEEENISKKSLMHRFQQITNLIPYEIKADVKKPLYYGNHKLFR